MVSHLLGVRASAAQAVRACIEAALAIHGLRERDRVNGLKNSGATLER